MDAYFGLRRRCLLITCLVLHFTISANSIDAPDIELRHFMMKLMEKYGDGNEMAFEGFEHLLHSLGLAGLLFEHDTRCHKSGKAFMPLHSHHNHSILGRDPLSKECSKQMLHDTSNEHQGHPHIHYGRHHDDKHDEQDHGDKHDGHNHGDKHEGHSHGDKHDGHNHGHKHDGHNHGHKHDGHHHGHSGRGTSNADTQNRNTFESEENGRSRYRYVSRTRVKTDSNTGHDGTNQTSKTSSSSGSEMKNTEITQNQTLNRDKTQKDNRKNNTDITDLDTKMDKIRRISPRRRPTEDKNNEDDLTGDIEDGTAENSHIHNDPRSIKKRFAAFDECLSVSHMINLAHLDLGKSISQKTFKEICPALIYQIDTDACHHHHEHYHHHITVGKNHVHHHHNHDHNHGPDPDASKSTGGFGLGGVSARVWGYSSLAVVIISLVGLLGVAVIPIMQRMFYHQLLQFLVALAVGALSGDALLHLLPHALADSHGSHGDHHDDDHGHAHDNTSIFKCLCGLMGIYIFYIMERCLVILTAFRKRKRKTEGIEIHAGSTEEAVTGVSDADEERMVQINISAEEPEASQVHKHGHGHSHSMDGAPGSVAAVAWMVILGDGIHNFCDGLAIGAAFVSSITGGFSTSIAVFCHELPHEIGDFAMLLKSGMTIKQAIFYNCVSSILCFFGMLVGVAVGNIAGASLWVFVVVAGMFLYIALVDMLPELTSSPADKTKDAFFELLLQLIGMVIGAGIMLLIAVYEGDLSTILE